MPNTVPEPETLAGKKQIHVAVAVIIRDGRVLIARRPDHVHQGGLLEFPGGKVEPGETVQQALVREIVEETGLQVPLASLEPVIGIRHDYGDKRVFLDVWKTSEAEGQPEGREGQPISWLRPCELADADFPAANRPIIRALNLPQRLAIVGPMASWQDGISRLERSIGGMAGQLVVLRAPQLPDNDYLKLAAEALPICSGAGVGLVLHGHPRLLGAFPKAAGLHLPWREAQALSRRPVPADRWLGVSSHDQSQLHHAAALGADYATLGPVLETSTHPGQPGMGWGQFESLVANARLPVYGLGGLAPGHETLCRERGGQGIAGIGFWW
ncbi:Nudix family hydrolase [Marinobacter alkaliphilus]|uniref:8-oxo-dGTP diphosphatase n=1 Tax=Marinobacter alkaliphilus TaxID=254719 RepID=A0ABZ3E6D2_9GAMM